MNNNEALSDLPNLLLNSLSHDSSIRKQAEEMKKQAHDHARWYHGAMDEIKKKEQANTQLRMDARLEYQKQEEEFVSAAGRS